MRAIRVAEGCSRCPDLVANRSRIVHGYGAADARVLFIGEAPGYRGADITGVPFTLDRSGVRLQRMLIELGLSDETEPRLELPRLRCFLTNVVRCNPPANRTPTRTEVANCLPYLWREIERINPWIVVPVGNLAAQAIFPSILDRSAPQITKAHARVFSQDGRWVLPMRHPARISNADIERFGEVLRELLQQVT